MFKASAIALAVTLLAAPPARAEEVHPAPPAQLEVAAPAAPDASAFALRHGQLTLHQGFGLATVASMAATAALGYAVVDLNAPIELRDAHLAMAGLTTGLYLTSATLALTAPPRMLADAPGPWDSAAIHRNLAWLHMAGMAATVGVGLATVFGGNAFRDGHAIAAYTTLGLVDLSALVIAFGG